MLSGDIIRGHLDSVILKLICEKDRYGYEVAKEIGLRTGGRYQIKEATLYAVFQRLEKKRLIESYEGDFSFGGRRRYYRITRLGRAFFREEVEEWREAKSIIDIFLEEKA